MVSSLANRVEVEAICVALLLLNRAVVDSIHSKQAEDHRAVLEHLFPEEVGKFLVEACQVELQLEPRIN
jgi:hypothetical protein